MQAMIESDLYGDFGNDVLYRMCEEHPRHDDVEVVHGKIWLIGRAYAAAIERKAKPGFLPKNAAQNLVESEIDRKIDALEKIERIDASNLATVLDAHCYLTERFKATTGLAKRSLASKYLHFHARNAVFIYDSIASMCLNEALKNVHPTDAPSVPNGYDDTYATFASRCLYYRDHVIEPHLGRTIGPRELDKWLYRRPGSTPALPASVPMP